MKKNKQTETLTGAVILNQLALFYNESLKHTRFYKRELKNSLNRTVRELIKAEQNEFDKVFDADSEYTEKISDNVTNIMLELSKGGFADMVLVGNILVAYKKDPKAINGIVNKVLNK